MIVLVNGAPGAVVYDPERIGAALQREEITSGLRRLDGELACFRLTAAEGVLRARIRGRPPADGEHEWCLQHVELCVEAFQDAAFGKEVAIDRRTPAEVAAEILRSIEGDVAR